uniref:IGFBP N-terminal domain-containing protein n=1 Tax=Latrodectus hesperus TaxID=256737 RepID=E7D1V6_LATHE|nr:hypothetical protein [Latrodectus hesperus]
MYRELLLVFLCVAVANAIVCLPERCQGVECPELSCGENEIAMNPGMCACCDKCLPLLKKGDMCASILLGVPAPGKCAPGLNCDPETLQCS